MTAATHPFFGQYSTLLNLGGNTAMSACALYPVPISMRPAEPAHPLPSASRLMVVKDDARLSHFSLVSLVPPVPPSRQLEKGLFWGFPGSRIISSKRSSFGLPNNDGGNDSNDSQQGTGSAG